MYEASTLYLVVSGAPAPEGIPALITACHEAGWWVAVFSTPLGIRFIDPAELERLTSIVQAVRRPVTDCAGFRF